MGKRLIAAVHAALMAGALLALPASAADDGILGQLPGMTGAQTQSLRPVQYYCRRECRLCRNDCYVRYRVNCYDYGCREDFVLCMRDCWNYICRGCG